MMDELTKLVLLLVLIIAAAVVILGSVKEVQKTNRKLVENGYEQMQVIGTTMYRWQKGGGR